MKHKAFETQNPGTDQGNEGKSRVQFTDLYPGFEQNQGTDQWTVPWIWPHFYDLYPGFSFLEKLKVAKVDYSSNHKSGVQIKVFLKKWTTDQLSEGPNGSSSTQWEPNEVAGDCNFETV